MSTNEKDSQARWTKVTTPLQYLALTHKQLLVFYGSVITVGTVTQRPFLAGMALVLAGLPQISMLLLSVVNRDALKALGEDASRRNAPVEGGTKLEAAEVHVLPSQPLVSDPPQSGGDKLLPEGVAESEANEPNV